MRLNNGLNILEQKSWKLPEMRSISICGIWMWRFQVLHGRWLQIFRESELTGWDFCMSLIIWQICIESIRCWSTGCIFILFFIVCSGIFCALVQRIRNDGIWPVMWQWNRWLMACITEAFEWVNHLFADPFIRNCERNWRCWQQRVFTGSLEKWI